MTDTLLPLYSDEDDLSGPEPAGDWVVLADGARAVTTAEPPVRGRRLAWQLGAAVLVVLTLVGVGGALVSRRVAQEQAVHDVAELTDVLAESLVQPALTDAAASSPAAAATALDDVVRNGVLSTGVFRVKLWSPDGTVLYSDEPRLAGQRFALDDEAAEALAGPSTTASVTDPGRPENVYERGQGALLEVYRPVWTPSGRPLLFETYFRDDAVTARTTGLWRGFVGIILSSLVALSFLLVPVVWSLLGRARRAQDQRRAMVERALEASTEERRRIAASLHDGVVQHLVGHALQLSLRSGQARREGDEARSGDLAAAAAETRGAVGALRSLLVEIHPPGLGAAGLPAALRDLLATLDDGRVEIVLDVDDAAADALPADAAEAVLRVAGEIVRNAVKHADARTVTVTLSTAGDTVSLDVDDDGTGFDASSVVRDRSTPDGHLGLDLLADAAARSGAWLGVASGAGRGTRYRMTVAVA